VEGFDRAEAGGADGYSGEWGVMKAIAWALAGYIAVVVFSGTTMFGYVLVAALLQDGDSHSFAVADYGLFLVLFFILALPYFVVGRVCLLLAHAETRLAFVGTAAVIATMAGSLYGLPSKLRSDGSFGQPENFIRAPDSVSAIIQDNRKLGFGRWLSQFAVEDIVFWLVAGSLMGGIYWMIEKRGWAETQKRVL
jgi:hypothetical protein